MKQTELEYIKNTIEKLPKDDHIKIIILLQKYNDNIILNENKNGFYINLSYLCDNALNELQHYISILYNDN